MNIQILGVGGYVPEKVLTNAQLPSCLETSDEWIRQRTGILQRHIAAKDETSAILGMKAAQVALSESQIKPEDVDLLVCATSTPDHTLPATAARIQGLLGTGGVAFDIQAACSGFIFALQVATQFLTTKQAKTALIIGAETYSRILDWKDRSTCVLFGDGAGAMVLQANSQKPSCVLGVHTGSEGKHYDLLRTSHGPSSGSASGVLQMEGREVYRYAVLSMEKAIIRALEEQNLTPEDVDWFIPHQANVRIIETLRQRFSFPKEKTVVTLDIHANTSAASIPLAFNTKKGEIKEGDLILLSAMGAGFTWGSALLRAGPRKLGL